MFTARIYQLPLTVVLAAALAGCAQDSSERVPKDQLYNEIVGFRASIATAAVEYLRRDVVRTVGDRIAPDVYSPSQLAKAVTNQCEPGIQGSELWAQIAAGTAKNTATGNIGPFANIPAEQLYWDPNKRPDNFPWTKSERDSRYERTSACFPSYPQEPCDGAVPGIALEKDLDYIVYVVPSPRKLCAMAFDQGQRTGVTKPDILAFQAEEQLTRQKAELAAVTYAEEELMTLVRLLPLKYRTSADSSLSLPSALQQEVNRVYENMYQSVMATASKRIAQPRLTHKREEYQAGLIEYGAWFQAIAPHGGGKYLYISPLLARAPFYTCYNKGAYQFIAARYRFIEHLTRQGSNGWRSMTEDDTRAVATAHKEFDNRYRQCIESQLRFVMLHEIAHVMQPRGEQRQQEEKEMQADCFALVFSKRTGNFDLQLFKNLVLNQKIEANASLLKKRLEGLEVLASAALPGLASSDAAMAYCGSWAGNRNDRVAMSEPRRPK